MEFNPGAFEPVLIAGFDYDGEEGMERLEFSKYCQDMTSEQDNEGYPTVASGLLFGARNMLLHEKDDDEYSVSSTFDDLLEEFPVHSDVTREGTRFLNGWNKRVDHHSDLCLLTVEGLMELDGVGRDEIDCLDYVDGFECDGSIILQPNLTDEHSSKWWLNDSDDEEDDKENESSWDQSETSDVRRNLLNNATVSSQQRYLLTVIRKAFNDAHVDNARIVIPDFRKKIQGAIGTLRSKGFRGPDFNNLPKLDEAYLKRMKELILRYTERGKLTT